MLRREAHVAFAGGSKIGVVFGASGVVEVELDALAPDRLLFGASVVAR
jgi:hypothetical protein